MTLRLSSRLSDLFDDEEEEKKEIIVKKVPEQHIKKLSEIETTVDEEVKLNSIILD